MYWTPRMKSHSPAYCCIANSFGMIETKGEINKIAKKVAQCSEQVGVALVQGVHLEAPIGLMILIQRNICDGRCISDHPKDVPASSLHFLPPTSSLHFETTKWSNAVAFSYILLKIKIINNPYPLDIFLNERWSRKPVNICTYVYLSDHIH